MANFKELSNIVFTFFTESDKDYEKWLTDHDYDEKSKTVKLGGRRVHIERNKLADKVGPHVMMNPGRKDDKNQLHQGNNALRDGLAVYNSIKNKNLKGVAKSASRIYKNVSEEKYDQQHPDNIRQYGNTKVGGINVPTKELKPSYKELDLILQHEGQHVQNVSDARHTNRELSWFSKYNYNTIPKEYREKFLQYKRRFHDKDKPITAPEKAAFKLFMKKVESAIKETDAYKNDKDQQRKDEYLDKIKYAKRAARRTGGLNTHDKKFSEVIADNGGVKNSGSKTKDIKKAITPKNFDYLLKQGDQAKEVIKNLMPGYLPEDHDDNKSSLKDKINQTLAGKELTRSTKARVKAAEKYDRMISKKK